MADVVSVEGLRAHGTVGVYPHEAAGKQTLYVDVHLTTDTREAARLDDLAMAIDYERIGALVREVVASRHHKLIETVAERIAERLLLEHAANVTEVRVRVEKPCALRDARAVAVDVRRLGRKT